MVAFNDKHVINSTHMIKTILELMKTKSKKDTHYRVSFLCLKNPPLTTLSSLFIFSMSLSNSLPVTS